MRRQRIEPGPGQESVWDYPRPPRLEKCGSEIRVLVGDTIIASTKASFRMLETSHPPVYYLPPESIRMDLLQPSTQGSFCEWKGHAYYYSLQLGDRMIADVAWSYPDPTASYSEIAGYLAFYPSRVDACFVDDEKVSAQEGDFYGGWITAKVIGPFKGGPNTLGW